MIALAILATIGGTFNVLDSMAEHEQLQEVYKQQREYMRKQRQILADKIVDYKIRAAKELRGLTLSANSKAEQTVREGTVAIGEAMATLGSDASIAGTADAVVNTYAQQVAKDVYSKLGLIETELDLSQSQIASNMSDMEHSVMLYEQQRNYEESKMDTNYSFNEMLSDFLQALTSLQSQNTKLQMP